MKNPSLEQLDSLRAILAETEKLYSPNACKNSQCIRERKSKYADEVVRTQFAIDVDKIIHSPFFNRGSDKTQVFSFFRNDDITRRASHVQLVSRIARTIGRALRLNTDLIEAIAVGHDIGHTPFGHKGEKYLNALYNGNTGRYFNHNVHSVRVLQEISYLNLSLQTVDGILCHCGEKVNEEYPCGKLTNFEDFHEVYERCYTEENAVKTLRPGTLEGCVVRISDMIAYMGKDRQDALRLKMKVGFGDSVIGKSNLDVIKNVVADVIANSMDKPYLSVSRDVFDAMVRIKDENNEKIYQSKEVNEQYDNTIRPMMEKLYRTFLDDLKKENKSSPVYTNHLNEMFGNHYFDERGKKKFSDDDIAVDFIASMTDDYFLEIFGYLFPDDELNKSVKYISYFDERFL